MSHNNTEAQVCVVITTINEKTQAIKAYESMPSVSVILVGDLKTPALSNGTRSRYFSTSSQSTLGFMLSESLPYNHYCRKNIGYLIAIQSGAEIIYDTDDDNLPLDNWSVPGFQSSLALDCSGRFINIYKYFTDNNVWPRGLPLNQVNKIESQSLQNTQVQQVAVWQGLANGDPDVDAIYRLIDNEPVIFNDMRAVHLKRGIYSPFNSQNTFWKKEFFPLLYLPSTTSFRFTDILRGYIAQRLIWEENHYLGFMSATVFQDRNVHDYMRDFEDEVEVYLNVEKVVRILEEINLSGSLGDMLMQVYLKLAADSVVKNEEIGLLESWLCDYKAVSKG